MKKEEMRKKFDTEHPSSDYQRARPLTKEEIIKVAMEYSSKGSVQLSIELNRSANVIAQVVTRLRREGINVPSRLKNGRRETWDAAIAELKKDPPTRDSR